MALEYIHSFPLVSRCIPETTSCSLFKKAQNLLSQNNTFFFRGFSFFFSKKKPGVDPFSLQARCTLSRFWMGRPGFCSPPPSTQSVWRKVVKTQSRCRGSILHVCRPGGSHSIFREETVLLSNIESLFSREQGFLPEAVVNFVALLGWGPGDENEIMSLDELSKKVRSRKCC